jgi:hypothetical protein
MSVSGSSSTSRSSVVLVASSRCFLRPSLTGSRMRGFRMALKMSLSPSMATKWRLALRQAWTEVPAGNQRRCKRKNQKKQSQGHNREVMEKLRTCGCSAIKNYVADICGGLNEQLEKEGVLLPTTSPRSAASHELSVLCDQIEEDIINSNVNTNKIKLSHRPNGEGGRWQPWMAPHQQLNAKLQHLQMNVTWYVINNIEI